MRHFLQYWRTPSADAAAGKPLWFASSSKYKARSISCADVLWIVTLRSGKLSLLGNLKIQQLLTKRAFKLRYPDETVFESAYYAVGERNGLPVREQSIHSLKNQLRFISGESRLTASGGRIGNSLQSIRELTESTVELLQRFVEVPLERISIADLESFNALKGYREGESKFVTHLRVERSPKLVSDKKKQVLKELGALKCEVCNFHVRSFYGLEYGDHIECHHVVPLAKRRKAYKASLDDLMLLCPNCHAAAHRLPEAHTREHLMGLRQKLAAAKLLHK